MITATTVDNIVAAADRACKALAGLIGMSDEHYSCNEAEAFADLLRVMGYSDIAERFLVWHAEGDDGGDDHFDLIPVSQREEYGFPTE